MLAATLFAGLAFALPARADTSAPACATPLDLIRLANPLPHLAQKIAAGDAITIVAIGSSSTSGAGASSPAANYPSRLSVELQQHFPKSSFTMHNRGVNGEEIGDMLARFDSSVIAAKPDLVLWQLGTNAVIRGHQLGDHGLLIREGLAKIHAIGADVVLIDPQFAPKYIATPDAERVVSIISAVSAAAHVGIFHRFALMRRWHEIDRLPLDTFLSWDGLHMNDWGYACFAKSIGTAITTAVLGSRTTVSALPTGKR